MPLPAAKGCCRGGRHAAPVMAAASRLHGCSLPAAGHEARGLQQARRAGHVFLPPQCRLSLSACDASAIPHPRAGYEARDFSKHEGLANDMGLFLQKTNIIRDYLVGAFSCCVFAVLLVQRRCFGG